MINSNFTPNKYYDIFFHIIYTIFNYFLQHKNHNFFFKNETDFFDNGILHINPFDHKNSTVASKINNSGG